MPAPVADAEAVVGGQEGAPPPRPPRGPRRLWIALAVAGALVGVVVVGSVLALAIFHAREARPVPRFDSLVEHPDPSLQGTVAYFDAASRCVRVAAASGQTSKDVLCVAPWQPDPAKGAEQAKEMGPQLVWRADGRLEVTMLFMQVGPHAKGEKPVYTPGWQKIVDVRTGQVDDVAESQVPTAPNPMPQPTVDPSGRTITSSSDEMTGEVEVRLTDATGTRTLLSAHGPGEYAYRVYTAFWAPNWQWIAVDDGRILVTTPSDPAITRVLVDGGGGSGDYPTFAVTADNLLSQPG